MVFVGEGRAKLLFAGEHAVLFGAPAVGTRLPLQTIVSITTTKKAHAIQFNSSFDTIKDTHPAFIDRTIAIIKHNLNPGITGGVMLSTNSNIPLGSGLGSSSALCVALTKAIKKLCLYYSPAHQNINEKTIAQKLESSLHGNSSGIDCLLAAHSTDAVTIFNHSANSKYFSITPAHYNSAIKISLGISTTVKLATPLPCYIAISQRDYTTKQLIQGLYNAVRDANPSTIQGIKNLININCEYVALLMAGQSVNISQISSMHNKIHQQLCALNLTTKNVDNIVATARTLGASSAKISGAGGGGAILIVFDDTDRWNGCKNELCQKLHNIESGITLYKALLSHEGNWVQFQQLPQ